MKKLLKNALLASVLAPSLALANHAVFIEGEIDFDGDGLLGLAEDADGDGLFGTINAALAPADAAAGTQGALAFNGTATIVTSGRFLERVNIIDGPDNSVATVTLEAAPGVNANIESVISGASTDPRLQTFPASGNAARQANLGVVILTDVNSQVVIRNIVVKNWAQGMLISGDSRVTLDNVRLENNLDFGANISGNAQVTIINSSIIGTGFRVGATGNFPAVDTPNVGIGVRFIQGASGFLVNSVVTSNFSFGVLNASDARPGNLRLAGTPVFSNRLANIAGTANVTDFSPPMTSSSSSSN